MTVASHQHQRNSPAYLPEVLSTLAGSWDVAPGRKPDNCHGAPILPCDRGRAIVPDLSGRMPVGSGLVILACQIGSQRQVLGRVILILSARPSIMIGR